MTDAEVLLFACREYSELLYSEFGDIVSPEDLAAAFREMAALTEEERVAHAAIVGGTFSDGSLIYDPTSWMWVKDIG